MNKISVHFMKGVSKRPIVGFSRYVSTSSAEKFVLPKPFINPKICEGSAFQTTYQAEESILQHSCFSDEDAIAWSEKYQAAAPFDPYLVPFPLRMGKRQKLCLQPDKFANLELMKVNNFLHLTPPAVKKQCAALKDLCTKFPAGLESDEACEVEFPLECHTVDYVAAAKSPRDIRSRVVEKRIRLCHLVLDAHARSKLVQLVGKERYDGRTDMVTIRSDRCPLRKQNQDYVDYVLTAIYFEAWKNEKWECSEHANNDGDDGVYWWTGSKSYESLKRIVASRNPESGSEEKAMSGDARVARYCEAVTALKLEPQPLEKFSFSSERRQLVDEYRSSVLDLLGLAPLESAPAQQQAV